ncbi:MAG: LysM domain-containing protein [Polyangiales bacterium]
MPHPPNSRYHNLGQLTFERADGREVRYLARRFCPPPERVVTIEEHAVVEGDRLDNLAARYVGDPEQAWRIADANRALDPEALCARIGARLRITLPDGIPGGELV